MPFSRNIREARRYNLILLFMLVCIIQGAVLRNGVARAATTFTVTNNNDGGTGSLRQAMLDANATPGTDVIIFNIGSGLQTIAPLSPLPDISDPVVIDGATQPGFTGRPLIELSASSFPTTPNRGVLYIKSGNTTIRGLIINHFIDGGITLLTAGGNHVEGCYIGTDATGNLTTNSTGNGIAINNSPNNTIGGTTPGGGNVIAGINSHGLSLFGINGTGNIIQGNYIGTNAAGNARLGNFSGIYLGTSNNIVGGTTPEARNVISANGWAGIVMQERDTSGNTIQGNYIGTDASGKIDLGNTEHGVAIFSTSNNTIGGTSAGAGNVISGNGWGVSMIGSGNGDRSTSGNIVQGNYIGVAADGTTPLGNHVKGVLLGGAYNTIIGGTGSGAGNTIVFNGPSGEAGKGTGVEVVGGENNSVSGNLIFSNGRLGIDLDGDGVTQNDPGDADSGGNLKQNYPLITSVTTDSTQTTITGTLNSTPNKTFTVNLYSNSSCDPGGTGEGARPFGARPVSVTTDASGNGGFGLAVSTPLPSGRVITATATDPSGNTSEFSPCDSNKATGSAQFASPTALAIEDVGFLTITVNRVGGSSGILTVDYMTEDITATASQDYTALSGTLTFADGELSKSIDVPIFNDNTPEADESLALLLRNPANPESLGAQNTVILTIKDNSTVPVLSINNVTQNEGDKGTTNAIFVVSLFPATGRTVTVNYMTSAVGATDEGVDFQPVSGVLTFNPRVTSQTISVPILGDTTPEPDERFSVSLNFPTNANVITGIGVGTILNDDFPLQLLLEDAGSNQSQVAALDSVTFQRDPFQIINDSNLLNQAADRNTRIIIFVANLQLVQGELSSSVAINLIDGKNQSYDLSAEDVRPLQGSSFTQIIFRLPNALSPGTCTITVKAHAQSSNSGTLRIKG